jgi:hypothetical protein
LSDGPDPDTPVSWFLIERGWKVVAADGSEIGTIDETVGDSTHDIFDGLTVRTGVVAKPRYVPAEEIARITEGRVQLKLSADEAKNLRAYEEPAVQEEVVPEGGSWLTRLLDSFRRPRT